MTAVVTLASLLGASKIQGVPQLATQTFLFFGAGQVSLRWFEFERPLKLVQELMMMYY
jgi:malic enzyme